MPGQHCPACGAVPTPGGCACHQHPDFEETAILPQLDGPELVRPYVPAAVLPPTEPDDFPTALMPHLPPHELSGYQPDGPAQDVHQNVHQDAHQPQAYQQHGPQRRRPAYGQAPHRIPGPPETPAAGSGPGGRAEQRARQREASPGRRRAVILSAGAGIAAVGAGLALLVSPFSGGGHPAAAQGAVPPVSSTYMSLPAAPAGAVTPSSASGTPSASPSRTKATHKATPSPSPSLTASATTSAPAKPSPSASPTAPSPTPSTDTPTPSAPVATPDTLQYGDSGPAVLAMQQKLAVVLCWEHVRTNGNYDSRTEQAVSDFQTVQGVQGDPDGVYGPNTRAALEQRSGC
ncbi:hypothetical protein GCM10009760_49850 [Kitasatospora kazusensis]|uniref:Peptidoglycan binding-like domain-containing protein n=1 Tax=Kitasatospora kazusensis TaxID=407974 RepID=A0ABN3A2T6_9ACTN